MKNQKTKKIKLIDFNLPKNQIIIPNSKYLNIDNKIPKSPERNNYNRVIPIKHNILNQNKFDSYESFTKKPSERLKTKLSNPFSNNKHKTNFSKIYSLGGIPCHLQHGSTKLYLQPTW